MVDVDIDHIGPYSVQIKEFDTQSLPDELALAGITYIDPVTDWLEKIEIPDTNKSSTHVLYLFNQKQICSCTCPKQVRFDKGYE